MVIFAIVMRMSVRQLNRTTLRSATKMKERWEMPSFSRFSALRPRAARALCCFSVLAVLAACSSKGAVLTADSFPERARELLTEAAGEGPVPIATNLDARVPAVVLADAAADGVRGLTVEFAPASNDVTATRLVVWSTTPGSNPCGENVADGQTLSVAFCRGSDMVADARSRSGEPVFYEATELVGSVRRATRQIFPDDWEENYGLGIFGAFGSGVSVGVGTSVGF